MTLKKNAQQLFDEALEKGSVRIMKKAMAAGVDINAQDEFDENRTALMRAVEEDDLKAVKTLIKAGADIHLKDDNQWNALHFMAGGGVTNIAILNLLLAAGADPNQGPDGNEPLTIACAFSHLDMIDPLIKGGAEVTLKTLRAAIEHGVGECAEKIAGYLGRFSISEVLASDRGIPLSEESMKLFAEWMAQREAEHLKSTLPGVAPKSRKKRL